MSVSIFGISDWLVGLCKCMSLPSKQSSNHCKWVPSCRTPKSLCVPVNQGKGVLIKKVCLHFSVIGTKLCKNLNFKPLENLFISFSEDASSPERVPIKHKVSTILLNIKEKMRDIMKC